MKFCQKIFLFTVLIGLNFSCVSENSKQTDAEKPESNSKADSFNYLAEQVADLKILRYKIPGWEDLSLKEQKLVYYLTQAGLAGRDIMWDQNYRYNLKIRAALEDVYKSYEGEKSTTDWQAFETYIKRVWFSNGIHHHYSMSKIKPEFSRSWLEDQLKTTKHELDAAIVDIIFNDKDAKKVNLDKEADLILDSAVNFYGPGVTAADVDSFYSEINKTETETPYEAGLNSRLVKENGKLKEEVWKSGGRYGSALDKVIYWLEKAKTVAVNNTQVKQFDLLIKYYKTGDLKIWDDYNIVWATNTEGNIDYINGFIEVYNDPKGYRGSYESVVQIKDFEMSAKMEVLSENAQWFEDQAPIMKEHKKNKVVGVSYKTVSVASEAGDSSPSTPIGINLPNNNWIREKHGSKSVSLGNIIHAYSAAGSTSKLREFTYDEKELALAKEYGAKASKLHTALHEVIGHASGKINKGVGTPKETLQSYASTLEEGRADLLGLYYLYDSKIQELGLTDSWEKTGMAAYDSYIRNGLIVQLSRIESGANIEESHMRNRHWVSSWVFEKGKKDGVIEKVEKDGKTYYDIKDYEKLRTLFGELLRETQRIKSEGDHKAAITLVETYGVKIDPSLHEEVLERYAKLNSAPYGGFINPKLVAETDENDEIKEVTVDYSQSFAEQMLDYSENYNFLKDY